MSNTVSTTFCHYENLQAWPPVAGLLDIHCPYVGEGNGGFRPKPIVWILARKGAGSRGRLAGCGSSTQREVKKLVPSSKPKENKLFLRDITENVPGCAEPPVFLKKNESLCAHSPV